MAEDTSFTESLYVFLNTIIYTIKLATPTSPPPSMAHTNNYIYGLVLGQAIKLVPVARRRGGKIVKVTLNPTCSSMAVKTPLPTG